MKTWMKWMCMAVVAISMFGCASQKQYDELRALYRRSQDQVESLKAQLEEAQARIAALTAAGRSTDPRMLNELQRALAERDKALAALKEAEDALRKLGRGTGPMLDPDTDAALAELAAAHPGLLTYDPQRGMVRFNADLTFALGSTEIKPEAVATLKEFASILNSAAASRYEVRIVGHTDNVPVSRPATKQKHPNNWYLSAHRSISVMEVLSGSGVPGGRLMVAGAGEFRPVVANERRGAEPNRRVEIFLVPMDPRDLTGGGSAASSGANAPAGSGGAYMDKSGSGGPAPEAPDMSK